MTQNRTNYLYKFTGKVLKKRLAIASGQSKYAGQSYYVLTISENQSKKSLQVFPSKLASQTIWTTIEAGECFGSNYDFYCRNQKGYYYLIDWDKKPKPSPEPKESHDLN